MNTRPHIDSNALVLRHRTVKLSYPESRRFANALSTVKAPTKRMRKALELHRKTVLER